MKTFLFASTPVPAHTLNALSFARRLSERGHQVLWYAGSRFHQDIAAVGAKPLGFDRAQDFGADRWQNRWPEFGRLDNVRAVRSAYRHVFVGEAAQHVADLSAIVARQRVDAVLGDALMFGPGLLHELGGPPWATFGDGPLGHAEPETPAFGPGLQPLPGRIGRHRDRGISLVARRFVFAGAQQRYDEIRQDLGLQPSAVSVLDVASPFLHLQGCTPSFEYPRHSLPGHIHWVGPLRSEMGSSWCPPDWWPDLARSTLPVIMVSQGSIRPDPTELLVPTIRALAGEPVLVVVITGQATVAELRDAYGASLPENVRCIEYVPYNTLLPKVNCFVSNGGYTGVTLALAQGVPLVQAGTSEEKREIGARIHWSGAGLRLRSGRPRSITIRRAVQRVLTDMRFTRQALRIKAEMSGYDAGQQGAALLERLAVTQSPVLIDDEPTSQINGYPYRSV